ncbi:SgcJ/EcaC family oxidoreductase [Arthrobacter sp. MDT3-24]
MKSPRARKCHIQCPVTRGIAEEFAAAWNAADPEALAALFVEDADFVNVVGLWWTNRHQIRENHAIGFRRMFPDTVMVLERVRVRDLGTEVAVVHARWTMTGQINPAGEKTGTRRGVISFTATRQSNSHWLAVSAQNTDIVPGTQTHVSSEEGLVPETYLSRAHS